MSTNNDQSQLQNGDGKHDPDSNVIPQSPEKNVDRSPKLNQPVRINESPKDSTNAVPERKQPKIIGLRQNEGRRTANMRELLNDLKNDFSNDNSPSSVVSTPHSRSDFSPDLI